MLGQVEQVGKWGKGCRKVENLNFGQLKAKKVLAWKLEENKVERKDFHLYLALIFSLKWLAIRWMVIKGQKVRLSGQSNESGIGKSFQSGWRQPN